MARKEMLDLVVRRRGRVVSELSTEADPRDGSDLRRLLVDAVKRDGRREDDIGDYEMDVRYTGRRQLLTTFVALAE